MSGAETFDPAAIRDSWSRLRTGVAELVQAHAELRSRGYVSEARMTACAVLLRDRMKAYADGAADAGARWDRSDMVDWLAMDFEDLGLGFTCEEIERLCEAAGWPDGSDD